MQVTVGGDEHNRALAGRLALVGGASTVDPERARQVAAAFAAACSAPDDPLVRSAYSALGDQAERWFRLLTGDSPRDPLRVVFSRRAEPYANASELRQAVQDDRVLEVGSVAHDHDRRHPLLDHSPGGAHDRVRAVHDLVSHGWLGHDFGRDGEFSAWLAEDHLYRGPARWALATELHAHHSVRWTSGEVAPYKAVLLDPGVLAASQQAGRSTARPGLRDPRRAA